ncbi:hypothetical protein C8Q73DRAFT_622683, partial [Cubamyces lactineus]
MIKCAKKYNVRLDVAKPSRELRLAMPIWYHFALTEGRDIAKTASATCLRRNHTMATVGQCLRIAQRLARQRTEHKASAECDCLPCVSDRIDRNCDNPHRCALAAQKLAKRLHSKWHPTDPSPGDGLSLSRTRLRRNEEEREDGGQVVFNPSITQSLPVAMAFRAFCLYPRLDLPACRLKQPFVLGEEEVEVYTDGSCDRNGRTDAVAGSGIWFGTADERNASEQVPGEHQTNQTAEIYAVIMAHRVVPPFAAMHIVTD